MSLAPNFARGSSVTKSTSRKGRDFEPTMLPLSEKENLCRELLGEFGVTKVRERQVDHELIHGCLTGTHSRQDREPTASINYDTLTVRCLGCGWASGILAWIAACRGYESSREAYIWLSERLGLNGSVMDLSKLLAYFDSIFERRVINNNVTTYSERLLEPWSVVHPYLTDPVSERGRGIPLENVLKARLGYAEHYRIAQRQDKTWITSERITIPHFWKGRLVGWQTRRLDHDWQTRTPESETAKYISSVDFPKDQTIYNYDLSHPVAVVTEAPLSVVQHLGAVPEAVATFSATVTEQQISLLAKYPRVVLCMDNDDAGWKAVEGYDLHYPSGRLQEHKPGLGEILGRYTQVDVWENPYDADPADLSASDFRCLALQEAVPFSVWSRPTSLLCYRCRRTAHEGLCSNEGEED
jgi:hypothetical protein